MYRHLLHGIAVLAVAWPGPGTAQTPEMESRTHWELGVNNSRMGKLRAAAPQIMPDCKIEASEEELNAFFVFWRGFAADEIVNAEKFRMQAAKFAAEHHTTAASIDSSSEVPLEELKNVGPDVPGATQAAKEQIENWHLLRCVDARFHGGKYSGWYGYDGVISPGHTPTAFAASPERKKIMRLPNLSAVEPVEALGKFFHAAFSKEALKFSNADEQRYFFMRYDTDYFVNLRESDVTRHWFRDPPWLPAKSSTWDDKAR